MHHPWSSAHVYSVLKAMTKPDTDTPHTSPELPFERRTWGKENESEWVQGLGRKVVLVITPDQISPSPFSNTN